MVIDRQGGKAGTHLGQALCPSRQAGQRRIVALQCLRLERLGHPKPAGQLPGQRVAGALHLVHPACQLRLDLADLRHPHIDVVAPPARAKPVLEPVRHDALQPRLGVGLGVHADGARQGELAGAVIGPAAALGRGLLLDAQLFVEGLHGALQPGGGGGR